MQRLKHLIQLLCHLIKCRVVLAHTRKYKEQLGKSCSIFKEDQKTETQNGANNLI